MATGFGGISVGVGVGLLGGVLVSLAPLAGAVSADSGPTLGAQPAAAILAGLLALAAPLLAVVLLRGGRVLGAVGVLGGWAAAAFAAAVADLQLFIRPIDANRFELFRPASASALHADAGSVLVIVGHVLAVLAGLIAMWSTRRAALLDDPDGFDIGLLGGGEVDSRGTSLAGKAGRTTTTLVTAAAAVAAAALFASPLSSTDPVVLVSAVVESPRVVLLATALLMVSVLVVVALALVSTSVPTGAGAVAGVALGALAAFAPRLLASVFIGRIGVGAGSVLGTLAAAVLLLCSVVLARSSRRSPNKPAADRAETDIHLPELDRMHQLTAVTGLLAGLASVVAALLPVLSTPEGTAQPHIYFGRVLLVAGIVLAAVCAGMLTGGFGSAFRPVVAVLWVAPVLGATSVLQAVLVATTVSGVGAGSGAWVAALAVLACVACGAVAGLAGAVERDDVDVSGERRTPRLVLGVAAVAGCLILLAMALPLYSGSGASAAAVFTSSWGWDSWGLVVVAATLLCALALAVLSRPPRALALLAGIELVLLVHLVSWPLTSARLVSSSLGPGVVFVVLAVVGVAITIGLVLTKEDS